jgi:integrase
MPAPITHKGLEALAVEPGGRREVVVSENLRLRVSRGDDIKAPTVKAWSVQLRHHGIKKRITIGRFPEMGLVDARRKASEAIAALAAGNDPVEARRAQRRKARAGTGPISTLTDLLDEYARLVGHSLRTWKSQRGTIERAFRGSLDRKLSEIGRHDVRAAVEVLAKSAPVHANRALRYLRTVFRWAVRRELLLSNPADAIDRPAKERSRSRILSDDELAKLWAAVTAPREQQNAGPATTKSGRPSKRKAADLVPYNQAALLMLLTAARRGEVESITGAQIDRTASVWSIPPDVHKSARGLRVPLTPLAHRHIQAIAADQEKRLGRPLSPTDRLLPPLANWSRWSKVMRTHVRSAQAAKHNDAASTGEPWTRHDIRRTVASGLARLGVAPHVIEALLGHAHPTGSRLGSVYQHYTYEKEMCSALQLWEAHLASLKGRAAKVIPLRRGSQ